MGKGDINMNKETIITAIVTLRLRTIPSTPLFHSSLLPSSICGINRGQEAVGLVSAGSGDVDILWVKE